jgi:hypothetical protein
MRLNLGVKVLPYAHGEAKDTYEVAMRLEDNYSVMGYFYLGHKEEIIDELNSRMEDKLVLAFSTAPDKKIFKSNDPLEKTGELFRRFLDNEEMAGLPGVPTQAALDGHVTKPKIKYKGVKKQQKYGVRRPSFEDTMLYRSAFVAWIEK